MITRRIVRVLALVAVVAAAVPFASPALASKGSTKEVFSANAVPTGGVSIRLSRGITFYVDRYATDEEKAMLIQTLQSGGASALRKAIGKLKMGRMSPTGSTGVTINAAFSRPTEKGRIVTLVSERTLGFWELRNAGRSTDYDLGFAVLELDDKDKGQGVLIPAAELGFKDNTLEVESYGNNPLKLMGVQKH
jgi:hypothetical protein